ncbi:MAG: hypothetical protein U5L00_02755 [Desulfovermiculus sp.]|nr:hypothetical protein [Desulfovermiculus sp.]
MHQDEDKDFTFQLREMLGKFPAGLKLTPHDLVFVGWLYFWEKSTRQKDIPDRELIWQIDQAVKTLDLKEAISNTAALDRLLQYRLVRRSITGSGAGAYCLTRLGRGLAEDVMAEINLDSDELSTHINHAYSILRRHLDEHNVQELEGFLRHVFLSSVAESMEYKLQSIEESILEQETRVKELGFGQDDQAFEMAVETIKTSRLYLEELLQTLQTGSPYYPLYELLYECREKKDLAHLNQDVEICLDFLDGLRRRIEQMLSHLINFIHECVSYQSQMGSLAYRDRVARKQQEILARALHIDLRMPVIEQYSLPEMSMNWSRQEQKKPVVISLDKLKALEDYIPEEIKTRRVPWKDDFLSLARQEWQEADGAGLELGSWLRDLVVRFPGEEEEILQGLWFMIQDMPDWDPVVVVDKNEDRPWTDMGSFYLEPVLLRSAGFSGGARM